MITELEELWEDLKEVPTQDKPKFTNLIEGIVYNIAVHEGLWQGDKAFTCGIFAEVFLDAKVLSVIEFMIPNASTELPLYWIVQKFPVVRVIPYASLNDLQEWFEVMFVQQTALTMHLFHDTINS